MFHGRVRLGYHDCDQRIERIIATTERIITRARSIGSVVGGYRDVRIATRERLVFSGAALSCERYGGGSGTATREQPLTLALFGRNRIYEKLDITEQKRTMLGLLFV
jgi:hypothetical protein